MKQTLLYIYILILTSLSVNTRGQDTLNSYLNTGANNNAGLKVMFNEYMAALEKVPQVGALPDPTIAFGYFIQPVETRLGPQKAKLSATQMFPWFGTLAASKGSAEWFAKARYEMFSEAKSKLYYDIKASYYNLFFARKAISITKENITILTSLKGITDVRVESGKASAIDQYRVHMEINDLENQLAEINDNMNLLKVKFNTLLNVDIQSEIIIPEMLPDNILLHKQSELDSVYSGNSALNSFNFQLKGLEYKKKAASKEGLPKISLGLEYAVIGKGNSTADDAGSDAIVFPRVGLTVPVYRKKYRAKVQEVIYKQKAKESGKADKRNSVTVLFETAWNDYLDAIRRIELYRKQTTLAEKSLAVLKTSYETNSKDFEEILRMERRLLKYALEHEKAVVDKNASVAFIRYLQGK
jgi:outer membrane protein TolC